MGDESPYSKTEQRKAIVLSAVLGWTGLLGWNRWGTAEGPDPFGLLAFAVIGLPIALLACWLIGGPLIRRQTRNSVSWVSAAAGGAKVAVILTLLMMTAGILLLLGSNGQVGYGDLTQFRDGMPTPYGLRLLAKNVAILITIGAAVGLLVRAAIGPGKGQE